MSLANTPEGHGIHTRDCLELLQSLPNNSVDLVFCSPPYEDARTYGIDFKLAGEKWVEWAVERYIECVRVSRGLVAWVVEGRTRNFQWSATPVLFMAELHKRGVKLRKPPIYHRVGIPGSGGPDWFRNDYEFIVCASKGKLPWSDNTSMGHAPKWTPGGDPSNRTRSGKRIRMTWSEKEALGAKKHSKRDAGRTRNQMYLPPAKANPGNVITCKAGGGHLGSHIAHENEAPFPEKLPEFFIRSCCPPGGIVLDIFGGSGTTLAAAHLADRICWSVDIRESQSALTMKRYEEAKERKNANRRSEETVEASTEGAEESEVLHADSTGDCGEVCGDSFPLERGHREDAPSAEVAGCGSSIDSESSSGADDFQLI